MSVSTLTSITSYSGNNSIVTSYVIPWLFLANGDVSVDVIDSAGTVISLTNGSDFVVTGALNESGGSLLTTIAYASTYTVKIYRTTSKTQSTEYTENGEFPAASNELALDKLTLIVQELQRTLGQSLTVTEASDTPSPAESVSLTNVFYGIGSTAGNYSFLNAAEALAIIELGGSVIDKPTASWTTATARALKVPDFLGQLGTQQDTNAVYVSNGLTAGDWSGTVSSISANSVGLTEMAHTFGNDKLLGFSASGVPEAVAKSDYLSSSATNFVTGAMIVDGSIDNDAMADDAIGLAELAHTYGNDKLIATDSNGTPEVVDKGAYANQKIYIKDSKASGTVGGTFTAGAWRTRDLTLKENDTASIASIRSWAFTSGGTYELVVGDVITGETSTETATIFSITLSSGTWAGGDAAGTVWLNDESGTFTSGETLAVGANANVMTGTTQPADTNSFLLKAGTYDISGNAPAWYSHSHKTRIYDATGAATLVIGTSAYSDNSTSTPRADQTDSFFAGAFTLSVESEVRLEHRCGSTKATIGYGTASSFSINEIYAQICLHKIA